MEFKDIMIWFGVFIVGSLVVSFLIYPNSFQSFKSNVKGISANVISSLPDLDINDLGNNNQIKEEPKIAYITIKDLSRSSTSYVGKEINVKGKLTPRVAGDSLRDNDGYWIWIHSNCREGQRDYVYDSETYSAKGIWTAAKPDELMGMMWGIEYKAHLSCTSPLK